MRLAAAAGTAAAADRPERGGRSQAAVAAAVLGVLLIAVIALLTPWTPLPAGARPATRAAIDPARDFSAAEIARSAALDTALRWPAYLGLAAGLASVCVLGFSPLGARLIGLMTRRVRRWPLRVTGAAVTVAGVVWAAGLPFDIWTEGVLREFGLSTQDWPGWFADQAKSFAVGAAGWTVVLLGLHVLLRRFPRRWWAGAATGGFVLVLAASFGYPVLVEPVFNSFHPMEGGPLRTSLLRMARADGVDVRDVLVADASRRTTTLNAYVSGFGSTRRIVVYDTLLKTAPPDQVRMIVAHELGHAENRDVLVGTAVGGLGVATGGCLLSLVLSSPRALRRAGAVSAADPRAVALVVAVAAVLSQLSGPAQNLISRRIEARADVHALELTKSPAAFVSMQRSLAAGNISDLRPDALEYVLWSTHPAAPERIALARTWAGLRGVDEP